MFTSVEIVLTFKENYFKKFLFFIRFVKKNIESINDFVNEILFRMQNSLV